MVSPATADRLLKPYRKREGHGISTTRSGTLLKKQIPVRTFNDWNETKPGFMETDLVAHCGINIVRNAIAVRSCFLKRQAHLVSMSNSRKARDVRKTSTTSLEAAPVCSWIAPVPSFTRSPPSAPPVSASTARPKELGIERPRGRNGRSVANVNTLISVVINVRTLQRSRSINAALLSIQRRFRYMNYLHPSKTGLKRRGFRKSHFYEKDVCLN